jgi:hypothetical protein
MSRSAVAIFSLSLALRAANPVAEHLPMGHQINTSVTQMS